MAGKTGLAGIEPASAYLPELPILKKGARWLFTGNKWSKINISELDNCLQELAAHINMFYAMQILEDGLTAIAT